MNNEDNGAGKPAPQYFMKAKVISVDEETNTVDVEFSITGEFLERVESVISILMEHGHDKESALDVVKSAISKGFLESVLDDESNRRKKE